MLTYTDNKSEENEKEEEQGALIFLWSLICFAASTLSSDIRFHDI